MSSNTPFCVIGHPLGHSMSPFIHDRLFALSAERPPMGRRTSHLRHSPTSCPDCWSTPPASTSPSRTSKRLSRCSTGFTAGRSYTARSTPSPLHRRGASATTPTPTAFCTHSEAAGSARRTGRTARLRRRGPHFRLRGRPCRLRNRQRSTRC